MTARKYIILGLIVLMLLSVLGILYLYYRERHEQAVARQEAAEDKLRRASEPAALAVTESAKIKTKVSLYFRRSDPGGGAGSLLAAEEREVEAPKEPAAFLGHLMGLLIGGPEGDFHPVIPRSTVLRQVFILDGMAVVDFSSEISSQHPGGVLGELATIHSIVLTITDNVSGINRVRILVDGQERPTLAGHVALKRAFEPSRQYLSSWKPISSQVEEENIQ